MKKKNHLFSVFSLVALLLSCAVIMAACSQGSRVAGSERELVYGYILEINDQANTVTVDQVELVSADNTQRINTLGLTAGDFQNGNYFYNARSDRSMFALDNDVTFDYGNGTDNTYDNNTTNYGEGYSTDDYANYGTENYSGLNSGYDNQDTVYNNGTTNGTRNGTTGTTNNTALDGNTSLLGDGNYNSGSSYYNGYNNGYDSNDVNYGFNNTDNLTDGTYGYDNNTLNNNTLNNNNTVGNNLYGGLDDYTRIRNTITDTPNTLYCLTVENGRVVNIQECSNY